ncbi:hypothetical protein EYB25_000686 [Talaromyces marneffei]|uniref:Uncharacterized protein C11D3.03c n=1 Tax=Talaromyces marneffei PM1 TaxID=1077442 RepID=A0A093W0K1_TALMA|nr:uncharacterized protein EYB26_001648 [Talaromyces marneffei]KAE8555987.1 hypothetical protein EYB25_000686 [Talaromyces marneffei]QGA13996.1 hypothetical protein EYB26_001648 [Talaromyces marneffei]
MSNPPPATASAEERATYVATHPPPPPVPSYLPTTGSPLVVDHDLYTSIQQAPRKAEPIESFTIPICSGRAWKVPAGSIVRISTPEGPQVGDLNIWNLENPRERFWASRTRQLHQSHLSTFDRLWSCLPYMRPLCTIIADSLSWYGQDPTGGRCHDLLGTRCDPYVNVLLSGKEASYDHHCHSNLTRAVLPLGLSESDVHDVINLFQVTGLDSKGRYFMQPCPAQKNDFIEFFAEQNLLMALSTCPGGDLSQWGFGKGADMVSNCRPLQVEVFELEETCKADLLGRWKQPEVPAYKGAHGLALRAEK